MADNKDNPKKDEGRKGGDKSQQRKPGGGGKMELKLLKVAITKVAWMLYLALYDSGKACEGVVEIYEGAKLLLSVVIIPGNGPVSIPFEGNETRTVDFIVRSVTIDGKAEVRDVAVPKPTLLEGGGRGETAEWTLEAIKAGEGPEGYFVNLTVYHKKTGEIRKGFPALVDVLDGVRLAAGGRGAEPVYVLPKGETITLPFAREHRSVVFSAQWVWENEDEVHPAGNPKGFNYKSGCNPDMKTKSLDFPGKPWAVVNKWPETIENAGFWGNFFHALKVSWKQNK